MPAVTIWIPAVALLFVALWFSHRFAWWRKDVPMARPRILMYHMVREHIPGSRYNKLRVPPSLFDAQIRWLRDNGWEFVTLSALLDQTSGRKRVAITFDDGYRDNLTHALPVLERYDACMTLYLVADREQCPDWPGQRKAARADSDLSREIRLSDSEVQEMLASGRVELGSHGMFHADLTKVDDGQRTQELRSSKALIESTFGVRVRSFCYPFGLFHPDDPARLRDIGYEAAVTTDQGIVDRGKDDPMLWPRVKVSGTEGMYAFRLRMHKGRRGL